ncbi:MAG: membrane protein insertase YidC [Rickettsiales bacterium]|nr:membrane protein insertase YidC [Rickettsiales bacterium]
MTRYNFQNFNLNKEKDNKMLVAIAVSMLFLTAWSMFFSPNEDELKKLQNQKVERQENDMQIGISSDVVANENGIKGVGKDVIEKKKTNNEKKLVFIENDFVKLAVDANNNRLSYLMLKKYDSHKGNSGDGKKNEKVILLDDEHFVESGYIANINRRDMKWRLVEVVNSTRQNAKNNSDKNRGDTIVVSGEKDGFIFTTKYRLTDKYVVEIESGFQNKTGIARKIRYYSRVSSIDTKYRIENSYAFRGIVSNCEKDIRETNYEDIKKNLSNEYPCVGNNWLAMSDQYWLTALISNSNKQQTQGVRFNNNEKKYQIDISSEERLVENNENVEDKVVVFVGAKNVEELTAVASKYNAELFEKTIDFGLFYFIAKPLLIILKKLNNITGNFGVAIILLTIVVRLIIFPLANRSYKATAKMKTIAKPLEELKKQYKDDRKGLQIATYELYKQYGVNPGSAILPMMLQIPVFFALYKVLVIAIEMRDSSFLWIKDLSSQDPTSIFNLFGLLSFPAPEFFHLGLLPLLMGITMLLQQVMTPMAGMDKTQKKMMLIMPLIFMFMFSGMPAGLILYWCCSNIFTIFQQAVILHNTPSSNDDDVIDIKKNKYIDKKNSNHK